MTRTFTHYRLTRANIVALARTLIGVEWRHTGRSYCGIDCVGTLAVVARPLAYSFVDCTEYPEQPDGRLYPYLRQYLDEKPVAQRQDGDILCFWCDPGTKEMQHVGIQTPEGMVHALRSYGRVVETSLGRWERRLVKVLTWRGLKG